MLQSVLSTADLSSAGSRSLKGFTGRTLFLAVNVRDQVIPLGGDAALTFTFAEVDSNDGVTPLGNSVVSAPITAVGTSLLVLRNVQSQSVLVSWTVTGTDADFPNVNAVVYEKDELDLVARSGAGSATVNGYVPTSTASGVAVRATAYLAQASAAQRSLSSTNTNDAAAGTGARTVQVTYYDNAMAGPFTEDVVLNGQTPVNMVATNVQYIEKLKVLTVGAGGSNAGLIQLWSGTAGGGSVFASIIAGDNQTFWAHHYVAAGKTCYLIGFRASATVVAGGSTLQTTGDPSSANLAFSNLTGTLRHGTATVPLSWDPWLVVSGPNLIIVNERPDLGVASTAYASFDYVEF